MTTRTEDESLQLLLLRLLVVELQRKQFAIFSFPDKENPEIIAYVHHWYDQHAVDVVVIRGERDASAYRAVCGPNDDTFAPKVMDYSYTGPAAWAIRAILTIDGPGTANAPRDQRPVTMEFIPKKFRRQYSMIPQKRGLNR